MPTNDNAPQLDLNESPFQRGSQNWSYENEQAAIAKKKHKVDKVDKTVEVAIWGGLLFDLRPDAEETSEFKKDSPVWVIDSHENEPPVVFRGSTRIQHARNDGWSVELVGEAYMTKYPYYCMFDNKKEADKVLAILRQQMNAC